MKIFTIPLIERDLTYLSHKWMYIFMIIIIIINKIREGERKSECCNMHT
jgi:hypothetical protein